MSDKIKVHGIVRFVCLIITALCFATLLRAGDEDLYAELTRRFDAVNDEVMKALSDLEYQTPIPDVPERVLSIRKNATVTIGGELRATYAYSTTTAYDPGFEPGGERRMLDEKGGLLDLPTIKFLVDARINKRWRVYMDFNGSNSRGFHENKRYRNPNTPGDPNPSRSYTLETESDVLNQAYIELMKPEHSGFGFLVGKMKMPFGLWDRPNLVAQSFLDAPNLAASYLGGDYGRYDRVLLPHASRMIDPAVAVMANYQMRDIVRFEAAVFQERDAGKYHQIRADGSVKVRNEASMPQSWQIGASIMPLDGWELTMHFRNRHNAGRGVRDYADSPFRWDFRSNLASGAHDPKWDAASGQWSDSGTGPSFGSTKNEQAFIAGLAVEVPNTDLQVRVEYARGWNQGFNEHIKSENVNLGLSYKLTPRLTVHGQGEWLHVKDKSWMAPDGTGWARDKRNNHLYRAMLGVEYEAMQGLTLEAGWQYEYWRMKSSRGADGLGSERHINKSNLFYVGTRFVF